MPPLEFQETAPNMTLPPGCVVIVRGNTVEALLDKDLHVRWGQFDVN